MIVPDPKSVNILGLMLCKLLKNDFTIGKPTIKTTTVDIRISILALYGIERCPDAIKCSGTVRRIDMSESFP